VIFAQALFTATPEMVIIGAILVGLAAIAHASNEVMRFVDRFRAKPPVAEQVSDLEEWADQKFATKEELNHAKELFATALVNQDTRLTQMRSEIGELTSLIRANEIRHEDRAIQLHNRINPLLEAFGAMRERMMRHSQSLPGVRRDGA